MFCVRVGVMPMPMGVIVIEMGVMLMCPSKRNGHTIRLTSTGAFALTKIAAIGQALHVVMMAGLGQPYLSLKTQNLGSVFAERAVHRCLTTQYFIHTLNKRVLDLGVVSKVGGMQKLDVWMIVRDALTVLANPGDENARKRK